MAVCVYFYVLWYCTELLDEGGLEGQFKDTMLSLRDDQIRKLVYEQI